MLSTKKVEQFWRKVELEKAWYMYQDLPELSKYFVQGHVQKNNDQLLTTATIFGFQR